MNFVLPPKSKVGYLDPEIAGEGQQVILSDGDAVQWTPPPVKPVIPDLSEVKSLKKYFGRTGFAPYPAWLYHKTEQPRLVKNADEAMELGVCYREASDDEQMRYGKKALWDWQDDAEWRPNPWPRTLSPFGVGLNESRPGTGKTVIHPEKSTAAMQNDLVERLVTQLLPKVMENSGNKPASVDKDEWADFLQFQAFKKAGQAVAQAASVGALQPDASEGDDRALWLAEAERLDVHIDKRWSVEKIKAAVEKAA